MSLISARECSSLIQRWIARICRFKIIVKYKPGKNLYVDHLSSITSNFIEPDDYQDDLLEEDLPLEIEQDEGCLKIEKQDGRLVDVSAGGNE